MQFSSFNNLVAVKIGRRAPNVDSKRRAQRMLRPSVRIGIDGIDLDSILGSGFTNSSKRKASEQGRILASGTNSQSDLTTIRYQN